ncbi:cell division protein FtsL [Acidocella sp.]|uniref:cell division protein FtsL n=1 Tax=Acidocella sp. TaxID=50710 RepID=UPI003D03794A
MIVRPFTFLTGVLFALSGAYLFVVKHHSQSLEDQLEQVAETTRQDEQAIRVLKAQWALEADPSRIAALAAQFTGLQPMKPGQLVTLASLESHLPAPGSAPPFSNPQDAVPAMPVGGAGPAEPSGPAIEVQGHLADAGQAGQTVAAAATEQVADNALPLPLPPPSRPSPPVAVERLASAGGVHVSRPAPHPQPRPQSRPASSLYEEAAARTEVPPPPVPPKHQDKLVPMGAQVVRVRAVAVPRPAPSPPVSSRAPLGGGSLLGMAQTGSQN